MSGDHQTQQLLSTKLRIIAQLKPFQKLDTVNLKIYDSTIITSINRTIKSQLSVKGNTRNDLYSFIEDTTCMAYNLLLNYKDSTNSVDINICSQLREEMVQVKNTISTKITETYRDDTAFIARLQQLANTIQIQIESLDHEDAPRSMIMIDSHRRCDTSSNTPPSFGTFIQGSPKD